MQPFIKYIATERFNRCAESEPWKQDPCKAFHALTLAERAYFLLGQCIFMHYINKLYCSSSMPVVEEYENYLKSLVVETEAVANHTQDTDTLETISICKTLLNAGVYNKKYKLAKPVDKVQITHVLFDSEFKELPQPCIAEFTIPFITWINADTAVGMNLKENGFSYPCPNVASFTIDDEWFSMKVHYPTTRDNYSMGKSFQLNEKILTSPRMNEFPLLQFIAMMDVSDWNVESILAFIASTCPHGDTALMVTNMHGLSYRLYCTVFHARRSNTERFGKAKYYWNTEDIIEAILEFTSYLHSMYGMAVPNRELLANIIEFRTDYEISESSRKLVDYLRAEDVKHVSTECYKAFTNSLIGGIAEYDIFSQNFIASQEAQEDDLDNPSDEMPAEEEEPDTGSDTTELDDASDDEPMPDEGNEDADTPSEEPDQDDTLDQPDDEMPSDETGDNDGDDGSEGTNDDTQPPENPPLNTSDKRGVEIKIMSPDDETTDSILFKEEMNTYLASLLKNPPASMSPQHVQLLTKLWKNWLYALDPQTTMKIVAMVTKLPVTLKRINTSGDPQ